VRRAGHASTALRCAALLSSLAVAVSCGSATDLSSADPGGVVRVAAEYFADEGGVRVGIELAFPEDRRVTDARLVWSGGRYDIAPYPMDGTDPDVALEFLDLPAGDRVSLEGVVMAGCPDAPELPIFEVKTIVDGEKVSERYIPDDASLFEDAFADFCEVPFTVHTSMSHITPQGEITVTLTLFNPGPAAVTVVSEAFSSGDTTWEAATAEVPGGTRGQLEVHGHSPARCRATTPWDTGHLLADGRPIQPATDTWC
jgi:hypothetical protein